MRQADMEGEGTCSPPNKENSNCPGSADVKGSAKLKSSADVSTRPKSSLSRNPTGDGLSASRIGVDEIAEYSDDIDEVGEGAHDIVTRLSDKLKLAVDDAAIFDAGLPLCVDVHTEDCGAANETAESEDDDQKVGTYTKTDIENTFTNLYCYCNLLEAMADDNNLDHYRFDKFMQQVDHKQSEVLRVNESLPDCANLAIELAYNFVVTSSYMNLMFSWETGKRTIGEEVSDLALSCAHHMLEFAHSSRPELVTGCVEDMVTVMQRFCLLTVVNQANKLSNLSAGQKKVLARILDIIDRIDGDPDASLSSIDLNESVEDSSLDEAVKEARTFGRKAYESASAGDGDQTLDVQNSNNHADDSEVKSNDEEAICSDKATAEGFPTAAEKSKIVDMDDLVLFTNCNPFADIWKLYIDNSELVDLFKIGKGLHQACLDTLPDCFTVLLSLENVAHSIVLSCAAAESSELGQAFSVLQQLVNSAGHLDEGGSKLLEQIVQRYSDTDKWFADVLDRCETAVAQAMEEFKSPESSDVESALSSDDDNEAGEQTADTDNDHKTFKYSHSTNDKYLH